MRYRISRIGSGFEFTDLTREKSQIIYDGTIITYYDINPLTSIFGRESHLKVSENTRYGELIVAIENEVLPLPEATEEIGEEVEV
jgi:hypothetical protein